MVAMDVFASAFGFDAKSDDVWTALGKVTAVNGNTLSVLLGGSATPMACEAYCYASVGDVVFVVISKGRARAIAVRGGDFLQDIAWTSQGSKLIPENTDLNTVTELGTWYRYGTSAVATLSNCPVSDPFKMFVERTIGANYIIQRIYTYIASYPTWYRASYDGGATWKQWACEAPRTNASATANRFLATPDGSAGVSSYRAIAVDDLPTLPASKVTGLGTFLYDQDTVSVNSATVTNLSSVTVEAGTWIISYSAKFAESTDGTRRQMKLSTSVTDASQSAERSVVVSPVSGASTIISRVAMVQPSSSTTYYLNVYHNAGAALSCDGDIHAVRIA